MVTLKDVAGRAGVSIASVSTVINGTAAVSPAMRARVQEAAAELGYVPHAPARDLKLGRTSSIGLVLPDITNPHFSALASAIEDACDEADYTLTLCSTVDNPQREMRQLQVLHRQRAAGVIFVAGGHPMQDLEQLRRLLTMPAVLLDRMPPGLDLDAIVLDNVEAGRLAADHLLRQGHRQFAMVAAGTDLGISRDRVAGCLDAMRAYGIDPAQALVVDGGFQVERSFAATLALLDDGTVPTGIIAASGHATVGVMKALAERGRGCPEEVSVVGIDDFIWADGFLPRLTVVAQPIVTMGRMAVQRLIARRQAGPLRAREHVVLQPRLIVRNSTSAPRARGGSPA